jgi:hypothetical protein
VSHHPRGFLRVFSMSPKWLIQKKLAITPRKILPNLAINQYEIQAFKTTHGYTLKTQYKNLSIFIIFPPLTYGN